MFLSVINIVPFGGNAPLEYGMLRSDLEKKGTPIGSMDTLIAAHARALGCVLVTNNTKEFVRVRDLEVVDWTLS